MEESREKCIVVFALIVTELASGEGGGGYQPPLPQTHSQMAVLVVLDTVDTVQFILLWPAPESEPNILQDETDYVRGRADSYVSAVHKEQLNVR
jgi:hypothetical protein